MRALKHIRSSLSSEMARTVANALVNLRLDCVTQFRLAQALQTKLSRLQRVQNTCDLTYTKQAEK